MLPEIMNTSNFSLEFALNSTEIRKLNKMYFKHLFKERIIICSFVLFFLLIVLDFFNVNRGIDFVQWLIRSLVLVVFFVYIEYSLAKTICKVIFHLIKKLMKFDKFLSWYRFDFSSSFISVHSPLGLLTHKWSKIEKVILTKNFLYIYIKEKNGYIISISNKDSHDRNIKKLIEFIENDSIYIAKV